MDAGAWIAIGGVALTNGAALLAVVVKRARRDQLVEDKLEQIEEALANGKKRMEKQERSREEDTADLKSSMKEIANLLAKNTTAVAVMTARLEERDKQG